MIQPGENAAVHTHVLRKNGLLYQYLKILIKYL
jgi:hypothetical protein